MTRLPQDAVGPSDRDLRAGPGALLRLLGMRGLIRSAAFTLVLLYAIHQREPTITRLFGGFLPTWEPTPEGAAWLLVVLASPFLGFQLSFAFDGLRRTHLVRTLPGLRAGVRRGLFAVLLGVAGAGFTGGFAIGMTLPEAMAYGSFAGCAVLLFFGGWESLDRTFVSEWVDTALLLLLMLLPLVILALAPGLPSSLGEIPPWLLAGASLGVCVLFLRRLGDPLIVIGRPPASMGSTNRDEDRREGDRANSRGEDPDRSPPSPAVPSSMWGRINGSGQRRGVPFLASGLLEGAVLALAWGAFALLVGNGLLLLVLVTFSRLEFAPQHAMHAILPISRWDRAQRAWVREVAVAVGVAGGCGILLVAAGLLAPDRLWGLRGVTPLVPVAVILGLLPLVGGLGARLELRRASPQGWGQGLGRMGTVVLVMAAALLAPALVLLLDRHLAEAPWPVLGAVMAGMVLALHAVTLGLFRLHFSRCALGPGT